MYKIAHLFFFCSLLLAAKASEAEHAAATTYIQNWKEQAIYQMAKYKIPASITLAQGLLESGNGTSRLAVNGNNHFGIKCHSDWTGAKIYEDDETRGECFRKYKRPEDSFEDHSLFLQRKRYAPLFELDPDDYKGWAKGLKECGYATNPKYPQLLIDLIERYGLHEYDKEGMVYLKKNTLPPSSNTKNSEPTAQKPSKNHTHTDRKEITIPSGRAVELSPNRIRFTTAKKGESVESIAKDLDLGPWQLYKYNDLKPGETLKEGDKLYLQPKRNKASESYCNTLKGESLRDVSQRFGIKLKRLKKLNPALSEGIISPGTRVVLK
jgi:LysM repeat protein